MNGELKLMASYVSKLKFILQKDQQQEPHTANLLVLLGSSNQDKRNGLSQGENRMDTCTRKKPRRYQLLTMQQKETLNRCAVQLAKSACYVLSQNIRDMI